MKVVQHSNDIRIVLTSPSMLRGLSLLQESHNVQKVHFISTCTKLRKTRHNSYSWKMFLDEAKKHSNRCANQVINPYD